VDWFSKRIRTHDGDFAFSTQISDIQGAKIASQLSDGESNLSYLAVLVGSWLALLADSPFPTEQPSGGKPRKLFATFLRYLLDNPIQDSTTRLASLADEIMANCHLFGEGSTTGPFIPAMKDTPIFKEYLYWRKTGDAKTLRYILSFLLFGKKAEINASELEPDALCKWLSVEDRLSMLDLDAQPEVVDDLRFLLHLLLPKAERTVFHGANGPGTVAGGGRSTRSKLKRINYDPHIDRVFFLDVASTLYQERLGYHPTTAVPYWERWMEGRRRKMPRKLRASELLFVPKTSTSLRSICREPATLMYFQQAVRGLLEDTIDNGFLSVFIDIKDQTRNQQACLHGSEFGDIDTIDLSSASDSVSLELVKRIFPNHILRLLLATRSSKVKYTQDGKEHVVEVKKFAPMGSAVCFPTQCIIYTAIGIREYARFVYGPDWRQKIRSLHDLKRLWKRHVYRRPNDGLSKLQPLLVYGDDILCDNKITQNMIHTLQDLGFEVNEGNSFMSSAAFRESCGTYAWNGEDVSPLRFKIAHFSERRMPMRTLAACVDMANRAGDEGYRCLHSYMIHIVMHFPIEGLRDGVAGACNPIRFTSRREEFGLYTKRPEDQRNLHLKRRIYTGQVDSTTCSMYQRDEVRTLTMSVPIELDTTYARHRYEYCQWWRTAPHGGTSNAFDRRSSWGDVVRRGAHIRWDWTPV
jgi:hypothetical protein